MGALNYNQAQTFDGHQSVGIAVFQLPGTNALDVAQRVQSKMKELKTRFPEGLEYQIAYDTTPFIRESVADVVKTLFEAVFLVGLVVLAFLQNWRSVLIPMVAVPVAIIGTFAAMAVVGFSLNNISLFGLVLAVGIVVDDAIVVVENVDRWLEHGLSPRDAARKAMTEVTGPIIAVALVLCAVFVPCAFISGITGRFFTQFAVTIAVSTVFSAINSLTLSPALAAILLRRKGPTGNNVGSPEKPRRWWSILLQPVSLVLGLFCRGFNAGFDRTTAGYAWSVGKLLRVNVVVLLVYAALLALTCAVFRQAPTGFVPQQDQGRVIANIQLPDAASLNRTQEVLAAAAKIARGDPNDREHYPGIPGVAHTITVAGYSFVQQATSSNFGSMFIVLEPFEKRRSPELRDTVIIDRLRKAWSKEIKDAQVLLFGAPPVPGLSVAGGFKLVVEDQGGLGLPNLDRQSNSLIGKLAKEPGLVGVSTQFRANTPQLFLDLDRSKTAALGVSFSDVDQTLEIYLGSLYVNSFNAFGRHWQVTAQAAGNYRDQVPDINLLEVRSNQGQMVPLGALAAVREIGGPVFVYRYNSRTAASITGSLRPGVSSGEVIADVDRTAAETLPPSMKTEWTELMYMQIRAGDTTLDVFALAVICVFLALAALYESWSLPLVVILVVPLCLLCSVVGVLVSHLAVDIFVQIGLVVLVGLACKNAILIVEFARDLHAAGQPRYEATVEASRLRLRPILMTSFAFILGVVPLVIASGAGAEMRQSLGTAVFSGMIGVTLFGIFLTPVFFYVILGCSEMRFFNAAAAQWIGAALCGGLSGAASRIPAFASWGRTMAPVDRAWRRPGHSRSAWRLSVFVATSILGSCQNAWGDTGRAAAEGVAMISHFFIDRPIFAAVLSIVFVLAGGVAVFTLPVAQYPDVTPPTVLVTALYPGANADTVRDTVAAPIEEQVNGVEGMMYMSSQSANDGSYRLNVTFKLGMDSDMAQVLVQNRVSLALPVIPALVQNEGIDVKKVSPNTLLIVNLVSPDGSRNATYLSNYATIYIRDELGRLPGVADITYFGQRDYSLRAWINPDKLAALGLTAADVVAAISQQNLQVVAGQIGQQPVPKGQQFQLTINTLGRLTDPEQFGDIIVKAGAGSPGTRRPARARVKAAASGHRPAARH